MPLARLEVLAAQPGETPPFSDAAVVQTAGGPGEDPLLPARLRGLARRLAMIAEAGGLMTPLQAAARLGVKRQAVGKRIREESLLTLPAGSRRVIPAFQFHGGKIVDGLGPALREWPVEGPWTRLNCFVMRHAALGNRRPIDALAEGDTSLMLDVAAGFGEHGAS